MIAWERVNQELIAKSIGELYFEQILTAKENNGQFELKLHSGVVYTFSGWISVWDHLKINPTTILRNGAPVKEAGQFFIDAQFETKMDDIILANFLEEMHNTLYSDLKVFEKRKNAPASNVATLDGECIQTLLNGHPKILLNKGRIGFGAQDLDQYAPESQKEFQLHWLAVSNTIIQGEIPELSIIDESFDKKSKDSFLETIRSKGIALADFSLLPVHPWQWDQLIKIQYAGLISQGLIVSLGTAGDYYRPQISIRTLSNAWRCEKLDIKLPVSILNTSCIRGLPAKGITLGTQVSKVLANICAEDSFLKNSQTQILQEKAGIALLHPLYSQIKEAPYRYHEYLGAIWRESSQSKLEDNETAIITASLFYQDLENKSLIGEYIKLSGLTTKAWLTDYFKVVVLPLYHLQLEYGVGMVAHGQNIILKLKNFAPVGMILKDFQGDLRLSQDMPQKGQDFFKTLAPEMTKLPPHYLIHDLITGHFVTVLRFISEVMKESDDFSEEEFYGILSDVLFKYSKDLTIDKNIDLLAQSFPRVLLNKVRFAIGYSDSSQRPLPLVGTDLMSPIARNI